MAMDTTAFETIVPGRYVTFTFPNHLLRPLPRLLHTSLLRIAVLDSTEAASTGKVEVAAMLVPPNRQHDWIFSTQTGHLQLLLTVPQLSRLVLISNTDDAPGVLFPSAYESPSVTDCETETEQIQIVHISIKLLAKRKTWSSESVTKLITKHDLEKGAKSELRSHG